MQQAIDEVKNSASGSEMLDALDIFIKDEWLGAVDELDGNIYRAMAFSSLTWSWSGFFPSEWAVGRVLMKDNARFAGVVIIWIVQVLGPPVMIYTVGIKDANWKINASHIFIDHFWNKLLALLLVIMFHVHVVFECAKAGISWEKTSAVYKYLDCGTKKQTSHSLLTIGAITNCWVMASSCICTTLLMSSQADNTKDVLFDILGICFLYNLDDIGSTSQLSFLVTEDWPGQHLAWVYERMLKEDSAPEADRVGLLWKLTSWILVFFSVTMPLFFIVADFTSGAEES